MDKGYSLEHPQGAAGSALPLLPAPTGRPPPGPLQRSWLLTLSARQPWGRSKGDHLSWSLSRVGLKRTWSEAGKGT